MKSPIRFFLVCAGIAAMLAASGLAYSLFLESRLSKAVAACEERSKLEVATWQKRAPNTMEGPWQKFTFAGLACSPSELISTYGELHAVQNEVIAAYRAKHSFEYGAVLYVLAMLCVLVGVLPVCWYFLLRRIREVAAAIRGERP